MSKCHICHLCHHYHKCQLCHICRRHHIFHLCHVHVIYVINAKNVINVTLVTNVTGVTNVTYITSVTVLSFVFGLSSVLLFSVFVCLLLSHVIVPASLIPSFVPQVLQSWELFYPSLEYSSEFSAGFWWVVTYSPSSIMPWKQLALSLMQNILSLYFSF